MKGIRTGIAGLVLCMTMGLGFSSVSHAEEFEDRPYTGMDEDGNIYELSPEVGLVDESDSVTTFANDNDMVVNFNTKGNAITVYTEAGTKTHGYLNGSCGADGAYLGKENDKVKFMISGVVGYVSEGDVQVINRSAAKSISHYIVKSGWIVHNITYNMDDTPYAGSLRIGKNPGYLTEGMVYYSYDGHYFYTDYSVMLTDYKNGNRASAVNANSPYFNYFQYLPLRSTTRYQANELDQSIAGKGYAESKLLNMGNSIISSQNTYGVNGLLTLSLAANESAWGTSWIAQNKNNLFGLNAVDSSPGESANTFRDADHCIVEFAREWMSKGYLYPKDSRYFGGFFGNKGSGINVKYASDPYWGEKAAAIAWNLDESMGQLDQYGYTLGVKDIAADSHNDVNIRSGSSLSSTVLHTSGTQSATAYIILNEQPENGFYRIQSDGLLNSAGTGLDNGSGAYNFSSMHAFISADYLSIVNQGSMLTGVDAFRDVYQGGWYYPYVEYMYDRGIMTGLNSQLFGVGENLVRAQFATTVHRLANSPEVGYESLFSDVPQGLFYTTPAIWAHKNGIMTGYDTDGRFGGTDDITREQMAAILFRYARSNGWDTSKRADLGSFPDAGNVQEFAREPMQWAVAVGLIQGDQGNLNPQGSASRVHCAAILTRFMQHYNL